MVNCALSIMHGLLIKYHTQECIQYSENRLCNSSDEAANYSPSWSYNEYKKKYTDV